MGKMDAFMVAHGLHDAEHAKLVVELKEAGCDPIAMVLRRPSAIEPTHERLIAMIERDLPPLPSPPVPGVVIGNSWADDWEPKLIRGIDHFRAVYGTTDPLRIFPEPPRVPWWERGIKLGGGGRCWLWLNVHGAGVRLWRIEMIVYLYGKGATR